MRLPKVDSRKLILLVLLSSYSCGPPREAAPSIDLQSNLDVDIYKKAADATVVIKKFSSVSDGPPTHGWGAATCIAETSTYEGPLFLNICKRHTYVFLTAAHVIDSSVASIIFLDPAPTEKIWLGIKRVIFNESGRVERTIEIQQDSNNLFVLIQSDKVDLAIVIVTTSVDLKLRPVMLASLENYCLLAPGSQVWSMGAPVTSIPSFRTGIISAFIPTNRVEDEMMLDVGVAGGCSGGGVYDTSGKLCGIVYGQCNPSMAIAIGVDEVYNFIEKQLTNSK